MIARSSAPARDEKEKNATRRRSARTARASDSRDVGFVLSNKTCGVARADRNLLWCRRRLRVVCATHWARSPTDALSFPKGSEKFPGPFFSRSREREILPYGMVIAASNPRIADFSQGIAVTT
jgi:hypothetical protein